MTIPRFYVPQPWQEDLIALPEKASHHAMRVLRMRNGDQAEIFDGLGRCLSGRMEFSDRGSVFRVSSEVTENRESPLEMTLAQAWVSSEKIDWIVEKAVEVGARRILLFPAERSVTRLAGPKLEKRLQKLQSAAVAACEQCGRSLVPEISAFENFTECLAAVHSEKKYILAPSSERNVLAASAQSVAFAVGPEGGFSPSELEAAAEAGWSACLLGPRVLRTETAGIVALAAANALSGDYSPLTGVAQAK